jgi:DegV family protein with EDD domain
MSKIAFVTDTISCLPPHLIKEYGIRIVPTILVINGKSYRDGIDMNNDDFWKQFDSMQNFSTSAALPGDFVNAFKEAGKEADNIICTLVSKALSATNTTAVQAQKLIKEENPKLNIEIIDSRTGTGAEGFVVLEGARAARAGKNLSEVIQIMQDMITRVKWVNSMETTKYLIKIGRAPKTIPAEVFLQMKPMISMLHNTGLVEDSGVARSKEESFQKMVDMIGENADLTRPLHVMVHYTNSIADGQQLVSMVKAKYNPVEIYLTPYSAVMCGTTGPCNAIAFYS